MYLNETNVKTTSVNIYQINFYKDSFAWVDSPLASRPPHYRSFVKKKHTHTHTHTNTHTHTHTHTRLHSSGRVNGQLQRPIPDNIQHSHKTGIYATARDSNPQSQQATGRRTMRLTTRPLGKGFYEDGLKYLMFYQHAF
jgi:hypothetical protein